jgi:hypothetical protein
MLAVTCHNPTQNLPKSASKLDFNAQKPVANASKLFFNASKYAFGFKSKT